MLFGATGAVAGVAAGMDIAVLAGGVALVLAVNAGWTVVVVCAGGVVAGVELTTCVDGAATGFCWGVGA